LFFEMPIAELARLRCLCLPPCEMVLKGFSASWNIRRLPSQIWIVSDAGIKSELPSLVFLHVFCDARTAGLPQRCASCCLL
jgi:hypothetical protein